MLETTDKESIISRLETTILELSSQGFSCVPLIKGTDGIAFFDKDRRKGIPTTEDYRKECTPPEKFKKLFKIHDKTHDWDKVDKIAIVAGNNGNQNILALDWDFKHFKLKEDAPQDYDKELDEQVWKIYNDYTAFLDDNQIPYYAESTPSGGRHIIFRLNLDTENNYPSAGNLCPIPNKAGGKFLECFANNSNGKQHHMITIAPSQGYNQLSQFSLPNIQCIDAHQRSLALAFFDPYQEKEKKRLADEKKRLDEERKKLKNTNNGKKTKEPYKHNLTFTEIHDLIRIDYGDAAYLAECRGYPRKGNRLLRDNSDPDIAIIDGGRKIFCHSPTDLLYNNGKPCDSVDILVLLHGRTRSELYKEAVSRYAPHQLTPQILNAESDEEIFQAINESSKDRLVLNIYQSADKSRAVIEAITRDGETMFFNKHDFLGQRLETTGFSYFSSKYITSGGSFSPLKTRILNEIEQLKPKILLETSSWKDGKFYSNSSEECYITHQLIEDSNVSFSEWKTQVFDVAVKGNGTALAMLIGFAAPFVDILHQPFGINFIGDSNIGKTMALRIAKSMYIYPPKSLDTWRGTTSALEVQKVSCANSVLCIDEMLNADENALSSIMQLCGVTERKRCSWDGTKLNIAMSNEAPLLILSSSEIPFLQLAKRFNIQVTKGQLNRFLDLNVTQDDFPPKHELSQLYNRTKKIYGIPIKTLCEKLEYINTDLMISEFTEFSNTFTEQLKSMSSASQRVFSHFIFLEFVAKLVGSLLNIDTKEMLSKSKELFARCLDDNIELFADGDALEIESIKEKLVLMIASSRYLCRSDSDGKPHDDTCFYSNYKQDILCYPAKLIEILKRDLNISNKKIWSIFKSIGLFGERRNDDIKPLGRTLNCYKVNPLEFLGLTDIKVNDQKDKP